MRRRQRALRAGDWDSRGGVACLEKGRGAGGRGEQMRSWAGRATEVGTITSAEENHERQQSGSEESEAGQDSGSRRGSGEGPLGTKEKS